MASKKAGTRKLVGGIWIITSSDKKSGGARKYNRNRAKCARYRNRVGKPRGRGIEGNKSGHNAN
jgi:hypothetical protein